MQEEIQEILRILRGEQKLNEQRHQINEQRHQINEQRHQINEQRHHENQKHFSMLHRYQELNESRYHELKQAIDAITDKMETMATKAQLNQVFETLSHDIAAITKDQSKLKKLVGHPQRRFN